MKKFLSILTFLLMLSGFAAGELRLADATGGAQLDFMVRASVELALQGNMSVSMRRITPTAALKALDNGTVDAVIIDRRFVKNRPFVPLSAEALALYTTTANPENDLTAAQVQEILFAHAPNWKKYNGLPMDIKRIMPKPLAPSGTLARRIFGTKIFDDEIFKVESVSAGFSLSDSSSIFFAGYFPRYPREVKTLRIDQIPPTSTTIINGTYPLALHYVIVYRKKTPLLTTFIEFISSEKYRNEIKNAGFFVLLPEVAREVKDEKKP